MEKLYESPLVTERLRLRPPCAADAPALFDIFSDGEVMRYWSSLPWKSMKEAEEYVTHSIEDLKGSEALQLGIELAESKRIIGTATLFHFHKPSRRAEIGYALGRNYWGKGYMIEAMTALINHSFNTLGLNRLEADIDPRNIPSARLLERLGFEREGALRQRWIVNGEISDTWLYGLLHEDWRRAREVS
ncbi:MAG: GNAT family N-acetyltransferase [Armatimonadetes bacterium]|nr:GNAT family N-acetyltransferase [Armatimonadota bacterium]